MCIYIYIYVSWAGNSIVSSLHQAMLPPEEFGFRDMASQAVLMVLGLSCHLVNRTRDPIVPKKHNMFLKKNKTNK